jgi:hypothetical protein
MSGNSYRREIVEGIQKRIVKGTWMFESQEFGIGITSLVCLPDVLEPSGHLGVNQELGQKPQVGAVLWRKNLFLR